VSIAEEVEAFIVKGIANGEATDALDHDTDLLASELIDSLGIVELIAFLESRYSIKIGDEDLDPENFRSVNSIARFVEGRIAAAQEA
jgi:acyl carrier protein